MPPLVDDLVEEVLLRLPPQEPASLVRAGLVCRCWRRLITDPGFSRRFREFHRSPPMLGILCNRPNTHMARFVPTTAFCSPEADRGHWRVLDARHGRVLLNRKDSDIVVWDPITDEEWMLPTPPQYSGVSAWTAAVLCAAGGAGSCDHLDCHRRPFVVVLLSSFFLGPVAGEIFICTYSSKTAAWSEPISNKGPGFVFFSLKSALVGNALYFTEFRGSRVLKYNLELREISWIRLPSSLPHGWHQHSSVLIATENGELELATIQGSKLCVWLRKDDACKAGDEWHKPNRAISLKTLLPAEAALSKLDIVGSVEGVGIIFMRADDVVYTIDLKTYKVKKVYEGEISNIIPYMSFYIPGNRFTGYLVLGPAIFRTSKKDGYYYILTWQDRLKNKELMKVQYHYLQVYPT